MQYSAEVSGQQWIGVSSTSPAPTIYTTSGTTSNTSEITIDVQGLFLDDIIYDGQASKIARLYDGYPFVSQGDPDLQKLNFTLQLPAQGSMEVSVISTEYIDYPNVDIAPSPGDTPRIGNSPLVKKGVSFNKDAFYPARFFDSGTPYIVRNLRAQSFQVYPLHYNPLTKVLRLYYHLVFKIENTGGEGENPLQFKDLGISTITGIETANINKEVSSLKMGNLPAEQGCMLVICPPEFTEAITPLVKWRNQTGIAAEIVNSAQFSTPEQIYDFVKEYYYSKGNLAYLLLVGDAKYIPPYNYPSGSSDNYYSYLAGNDHYPDILVGRFSAESVKDVEIQVSRTLQYEKDPGTDASWLSNATGIASTLSPGDDGESDFQHIRNLLKTLKTTTYTQANEFFDGSQGEADADGNPSASDISNKINQGTGIIFYAGHGSPSTWVTGSVSKSVVEGLNNTGKYPLIWAAACENGNFAEKYCLAEAWLRAKNSSGQPTGALAAVMSSGTQTSFPPMEAQDKIAEIMSDPQSGIQTMGAVSVKGMMSMNDVYGNAGFVTTDNWILFGDPSLMVRSAEPKQFATEHKGYIGESRNVFSVKCNAEEGYACLSRNGEILGKATISEGSADIYLDYPVSGENLTLTLTALNYLPYIASIEIINTPGNPEWCTPLNHSRRQPINSRFEWDNGDSGKPEYYLFYLGTDNPPTNLINGLKLTETQFKTSYNLEYDQTYYWRVVAINSYGVADGKVMDFETVFAPDEDFEPTFKSRLKWDDGGMQKWITDGSQHFDGQQSIRSGQIADNEYTSLIYLCEVTTCDFVSFWCKTSSEEGDKLKFIVDGKKLDEWSGISGWNFSNYKIEPGIHQLEWRYEKNGTLSSGDDAAWLDNIHLPVHAAAKVSVPESGSVCSGSEFETSAIAENFFAITWYTEGDGTFEDKNLANASYKPGILDSKNGESTIRMKLESFTGCPVIEKTVNLSVNSLPVIPLPSDTIVTSGREIELDATVNGDMAYTWMPGGSHDPHISIDPESTGGGINVVTISLTNPEGCIATKEISIHFINPGIENEFTVFPNPSNGNFSLQPVNGTAIIDRMSLVDKEGKVIWRNEENVSILGSKQVSVNGVTGGTYFLVMDTPSGRTVNPLVIQ